jgi:large subunit ribosomal protein L34e
MPAGKHKSRTLKRVFVRTPGSKSVLHYRKRKPSSHKCATCKKTLAGTPKDLPSKIRHMSKSSRTPQRPYGGNLCSVCTRALLKEKARRVEK